MNVAKKINLEKILSPLFKENKGLQVFYKIAQGWEGFIEPIFVNITQPLKLAKDNDGRWILFVAVPNSSVSSQFYYSKEKIISNISLHLGQEAIAGIKTILRPLDEWAKQKSHSINKKSDDSGKEMDLEEKFGKLALSIRENF
jgi:hypothetical protein